MKGQIVSAIKSYDELTFRDDFMFVKTMEDTQLCRAVIECLQQSPVGELYDLQGQKEYRFTSEGKPVRLDICTRNDSTVYDVEMQNLNHRSVLSLSLPRRSRFYQAAMDTDHMNKGESYKSLPDSRVMFVCTFDPFGYGLSQYSFQARCDEQPDLPLKDGAYRFFYNCTYEGLDIPESLAGLYKYIRTGEACDELTERIDEAVLRARKNEEWRSIYMKEWFMLQDAKEEGREQGLEEARELIDRERRRAENAIQRADSANQRAERAEARVRELEAMLATS